MYDTIKNIWLDVTPKVHANLPHDDRIILEQEIELNADMGNGHGEIGNGIGNGNGEGNTEDQGNGEVEGEGEADEWEDLNEDADADGDDVDDTLHFIESRTGTFPPVLTLNSPSHISSFCCSTLRCSPLIFSTSLLFNFILFTSLCSSLLFIFPIFTTQ